MLSLYNPYGNGHAAKKIVNYLKKIVFNSNCIIK